jgi:hypothetical protein
MRATKLLRTLAYVSIALTVVYFAWIKEFIAIDRCMDYGGAYDTQQQVCDKDD